MKKLYFPATLLIGLLISILLVFKTPAPVIINPGTGEGSPEKDRVDLAMQQDFDLTKDLRLNYVPRERLINAMKIKNNRIAQRALRPLGAVTGINWQERGPSNVGGRTRAVLFDLNDAANGYKKIWAGSVAGGLWYTNDITAASPVWNKVNDFFDNIAITSIVQNPANPQEMYFGTGEGWFNGDAVQGLGIWKSTDGGLNWTRLPSTTNFNYINDLLIDQNGNLLAAVRERANSTKGILRSTNGGNNWTQTLGGPVNTNAPYGADLELAANGDIYACLGTNNTGGGIFISDFGVNGPNTGAPGTWTDITPNSSGTIVSAGGWYRVEIACAPSNSNISYALFQAANTTGNCSSIQQYNRRTNAWSVKTVPTIIDQGNNPNFTRGQAWYDLVAAVDPNDSLSVYIGGVDALRSNDAGTTWTQMTSWSLFNAPAFSSAQNVHADHHAIIYAPGSSSRAVWGTDGGIDYTINANVTGSKPTFVNKNTGYNVTQFYSAAIHPTATNYFLGGTQDNGTQQFNAAGVNSTTEVTGGDGGFCHIDQDNPNIQITSYIYNNYFVSTNGGASFVSRNFNNYGSFINPTDYDNLGKKLYAGNLVNSFSNINTFLRWDDPATAGFSASFVTVPQFNGTRVTNVTVSPLTPNRVYFGLQGGGGIVRVDNANTGNTKTGVSVGGSFTFGSISCIAIDPANEDHMLATVSNYGQVSVFECKNATQASPVFTAVEGNLPDMPVRWAMFDPRNSDQAIIATELGVWSTDNLNGASTDWQPTNSGLANTRVDMLQYRTTDRTIVASTHGRGLFTAIVPNLTTPDINFTTATASVTEQTAATTGCRNYIDYSFQMSIANAPVGDATVTLTAQPSSGATQGNDFDITTNGDFTSPSTSLVFANGAGGSKTISLRIYNDAEVESSEMVKIGYSISGTTTAQKGLSFQTYTVAIADNDIGVVADGAGDYTSGNANTNATTMSPFRADKLKHRLQTIYTAGELKAAGFLSGGNITALQVYVVSPNAYTFNGFTVSLANTSLPGLSNGFAAASFTQVYTGNYTTTAAGQFNAPTVNNIPFTTPFAWDGVSNIIVQYCFDNGPNAAGVTYIVQGNSAPLGTGVKTSAFSDYTNQSTAGCSLSSAFVDDNRPRTTFTASFTGTTIASVLNTTRTEHTPGNSDQYFYSATGELLARIKNTGANNYGCTQLVIDRAGTGSTAFWNNTAANYLMNKTYRILPTSNNASGTYEVTFYFTKAEVDGWAAATGQLFANIQMVKVPGQISGTTPANPLPGGIGSTQIVTPAVTSLGTKYALTATFSNGFSGFGFGIPGNMVTLPITLLNFSGRLRASHSVLEWTTSAEINSKHFDVQRSYDGTNFTHIGTVKAAGNSSTHRNYNLLDKQVAASINYYRLVMKDMDGQQKISSTVIIKNTSVSQGVHVMNNPFRNTINIRFDKIPSGKISFTLTDLNGKRMAVTELSSPGFSTYQLDLSKVALARGVYLLSAVVDGKRYGFRMVKE